MIADSGFTLDAALVGSLKAAVETLSADAAPLGAAYVSVAEKILAKGTESYFSHLFDVFSLLFTLAVNVKAARATWTRRSSD